MAESAQAALLELTQGREVVAGCFVSTVVEGQFQLANRAEPPR